VTEFFNTKNARTVFKDLGKLKHKDQLETRLTAIAVKKGLNYAQASQAAKDILGVFLTNETVLRDTVTDADLVLDQFFSLLDSSGWREEDLASLYMSKKLAEDPVVRARLHDDYDDPQVVELRDQCAKMVRENYRQVRDEMYQCFRRFNLPKGEMKKLLEEKLLYSTSDSDYRVGWDADTIREQVARGAITAMHLYLDNRSQLTPDQAAAAICTVQDATAFHDAVIAGQERMAAVKDVLWEWCVLYVALAVLILLCGLFYPEAFAFFLITAAVLVVVGGVPALLSHPIGALLGVAKVKVNNENRNQVLNQAEDTAFVDPTGLFDAHNYEQWDEMTDNALVY